MQSVETTKLQVFPREDNILPRCTNFQESVKQFSNRIVSWSITALNTLNTWSKTVLMKVLTAGVNAFNSFSPMPTPLKHHKRMPPLLKMVKKSSILTNLGTSHTKKVILFQIYDVLSIHKDVCYFFICECDLIFDPTKWPIWTKITQ